MEGRQIVQWDKDSCADAVFLKIDLLGLGMLPPVERCVEEIAAARERALDLSRIPLDDPPTFEAIRAAETTGVFQIESRAQMQMLPRSLPETLDDVIVQVALVRPARSRAAPCIPIWSAAGCCARTRTSRCRTTIRASSRSSPTRSGRSSFKTR